jgi:putative hydrolase of the HAD superfamily
MKSNYVVLWDADGVVFNDRDENGAFLWSKTIEADLGVSVSALEPLWGPNFIEVIQGKGDMRLHVESCFIENGITVPVDDFIAYWLMKDADINDDVLQLVNRHQSYLATNQEHLRTNHLEEILRTHIKKVFSSGRIGTLKTDPAFFAFVEQDLQMQPESLYFIDDTLENIEVAKSRGWQAYHFTGIHSLPDFLKA